MYKDYISLIGDFLYLPVSFVQKDLPSGLVGIYAALRHVKGLHLVFRADPIRSCICFNRSRSRAQTGNRGKLRRTGDAVGRKRRYTGRNGKRLDYGILVNTPRKCLDTSP